MTHDIALHTTTSISFAVFFSPRYHKGAGAEAQENAKLIQMMQMQLANAGKDLDMESIYKGFREEDRQLRGTMSKEQVLAKDKTILSLHYIKCNLFISGESKCLKNSPSMYC